MSFSTVSEIHTVVRPFIEICALRRRPQDLPTSTLLLGVTLTTHTLSSFLLQAVTLETWTAFLAGVTDTLLVVVLSASLLFYYRLRARIVQTLTAMTGAGTVIALVAIPLWSWSQSAQQGDGSPFAALLVLSVFAWSLAVSGHILRHALSVPYFVGIFIAFGFFWISHSLFIALFPVGN
jgi:hypothetical protein